MNSTSLDKAVILARGLGTRMRDDAEQVDLDARDAAAADTGVKALIRIDRPFLDYLLSALTEAGYRRVCLVIGPEHEAIRDYYTREAPPAQIAIDYAIQAAPKGTADAVAAAESFAGDDPFIMLNSDNYYPIEALRRLRELPGCGLVLFEQESMLRGSNIPPERIHRFCVGRIDEQGMLAQILEKPDEATLAALPRPLWLSMNCWRFGPSIFQACRAIKPSPRGEYEVTDAVQYTMDTLGEPYSVVTVRAPVLDLTGRKDIAAVRERLTGVEVAY